jgi:phytol kinase
MEIVGPGTLSALYFALVLATGETLRRGLEVAPDVTRKAVLGLLSVWAVPAALLFPDPRAAALPFLGLALGLYLSFRFELFASIEDDGASLGSVLAPLSAALLFRLLGRAMPHVAVAGVLAIAFGDAPAALVGRRLGTRKYRVLGHARTMEGTLALFLGASIASAPVLALMGGVDWHRAVAFSLIAGTVGASVEAVSPLGTDNLTVPLGVAGTLVMLVRASA